LLGITANSNNSQNSGGQVYQTEEHLENLRRGLWIDATGQKTALKLLSNERLYRIVFLVNEHAAGNSPSNERAREELAILKKEVMSRGIDHPLFKGPRLCSCGNVGLRIVGNQVFCKRQPCMERAKRLATSEVVRVDKKNSALIEENFKKRDAYALHRRSVAQMSMHSHRKGAGSGRWS
jgi:hypothetical protein